MASEASRSGASADSYIGSLISLTSKSEIRYEGVLYNINTSESSIGLCNVRSFGTEGRKKDGPQIPASDKIYEYILFRGSDIKDLQVKSSPSPQPAPIHSDPAIIQSQYSHLTPAPAPVPVPAPASAPVPAPAPAPAASSLPSFGGVTALDNSNTAQSGLARPTFQGALPPYQPGGSLASWGSTPPLATNGSGLTMPTMYWQGYYASSGVMPQLQPPSVLRPSGLPVPPMQQPMQYPAMNTLIPSASTNLTEHASPLLLPVSSDPSVASNLPSSASSQAGVLASSPSSMLASNQVSALAFNHASVLVPSQASVLAPVQANASPPNQVGVLTPIQASIPTQASVLVPIQANNPTQASVLVPEKLPTMLPNKPPAASYPATTITPNMPPLPPLTSSLDSLSNVSQTLPSIVGSKPRPNHSTSVPNRTTSQSMPSIISSSISSQVEAPVPVANPGQLLQSLPSSLPLSQPPLMVHKEAESKTYEAKVKLPLSEPAPAEVKEPILPLPTSIDRKTNGSTSYSHQNNRGRGRGRGNGYQRPITKFTEDFDFTAMNEKFKKDEVWGHLGKSRGPSRDREGDAKDEVADEEEGAETERIDKKPVYVKDDFFDSLSSNTLDPGSKNGRMKFSEQMKIDTETFGDFPRHRPIRGGGRGPRGGRSRGSFYGRGYGYAGRGRGQAAPSWAS